MSILEPPDGDIYFTAIPGLPADIYRIRDPWDLVVTWHRHNLATDFPHLLSAARESGGTILNGVWIEYLHAQCISGHLPPPIPATAKHTLRTEHLASDWSDLKSTLKIDAPSLDMLPSIAQEPHYSEFYSPEAAASVAIHYSTEISLGSYRYPWLPGDAVASLLKGIGIPACKGCNTRRAVLNNVWRKAFVNPKTVSHSPRT